MSLISEAKGQFSHIGEYGRPYMENADSVINECSEKGIDILQVIDEKISVFFGRAESESHCSEIPEERTVVPQDDKTWHYVSSGFLPDKHQDVLILSASGQVMEGYLMEKDISQPFVNDAGKIDFPPFENGGAWFRYRFRDTLKMTQVVAWCYKPYVCDRNMEKRFRIGDLLARLDPATTVLVNDKPYDKLWDDKRLIRNIEVSGATLHITAEKGRI